MTGSRTKYHKIWENISLPSNNSFEAYKDAASKNIVSVFDLWWNQDKLIPFQSFLNNSDHWAEHTHNVYKKSLEIAQTIENTENISIDPYLLFVMSSMHDSWRFRLSIPKTDDTEKQIQAKQKKRTVAERKHNEFGVAQINLAVKKLKEKWISIDPDQVEKIKDYIFNHDFFSTRLDWIKYKEPTSIEGQVVRLADRVSVTVEEEIVRYRETGKRLNTRYFNDQISFEERVNFTFENMWNYIKTWKFDEFTFFLALLSMSPDDFENKTLKKIYSERSINKQDGINKILKIAEEESYTPENIKSMKKLITDYLFYFNIKIWE